MTTQETTRSSRASRARAALSVSGTALAATVLMATVLAAPARADVPEGWSDPDPVDTLDAVLLLGGGSLLLFVVIALLVYIPSMIRGERLLPDHGAGEAQWLGGPADGTAELPAPDDEKSRTGGASGSW